MRAVRKDDESWAIGLLLDALLSSSPAWREDPDAPTDKPDLVLVGPRGVRVACEITQVSLSEWMKWQNDSSLDLAQDELDQMLVPREVDLWLEKAIGDTVARVPEFMKNASASEMWLLVHGGFSRIHDLFDLAGSEHYDIPLLVKAAEEGEHPFDRIYVASANADRIVCVFPYDGLRYEVPDITNPDVLRMGEVRSMSKKLHGGTPVPIGEGFAPDRDRRLPLLDPSRLRVKGETLESRSGCIGWLSKIVHQ